MKTEKQLRDEFIKQVLADYIPPPIPPAEVWTLTGANLPAAHRPQWVTIPDPRPRLPLTGYTFGSAEDKVIGLKVMALIGDQLMTTYQGDWTVYHIGHTLRQEVKPFHQGGYYAYLTTDPYEFIKQLNTGEVASLDIGQNYAICEVQLSGPFCIYDMKAKALPARQIHDAKKIAGSSITPLKVLTTYSYPGGLASR